MNRDDDDIELDEETTELKHVHDALVGDPIGMALDMAKDLGFPYTIRVMRIDGKNCIGTTDYNPNRVNVSVVDGIVKSIISIG